MPRYCWALCLFLCTVSCAHHGNSTIIDTCPGFTSFPGTAQALLQMSLRHANYTAATEVHPKITQLSECAAWWTNNCYAQNFHGNGSKNASQPQSSIEFHDVVACTRWPQCFCWQGNWSDHAYFSCWALNFRFLWKHVTEPKPVKVLRTFYGGDQFRFLSPSISRLAQVGAKASWLPEVCCQLGNDPRLKWNSQQQVWSSSSFRSIALVFPWFLVSFSSTRGHPKVKANGTRLQKVRSVEAPQATLD